MSVVQFALEQRRRISQSEGVCMVVLRIFTDKNFCSMCGTAASDKSAEYEVINNFACTSLILISSNNLPPMYRGNPKEPTIPYKCIKCQKITEHFPKGNVII